MKCAQCQHENPAGRKFCGECGARLTGSCPSCGALNLPAQKFCGECGAPLTPADATKLAAPDAYTPRHLAEKILASRSAIEGERKPVTVLFCDVVRSTALAEQLGAERMHALLSRFFEVAIAEIHRYEGTINQFLGDGFMALFGAPLAHEDHARRAVLAALDLRRVLHDQPLEVEPGAPVPVSLRFGLHTGFVVVGAIGDNLRMDYTAVGDTTHLAARLQQMAEPGAIVISDTTAQLVRGYVQLETQGPVEIRGRSAPMSVHLVVGRGPRRSPLDARPERPLSQFVGRTREISALRALQAEVEAGRGQVVGIVGEPGVGKSRLLIEFQQALTGRPVRYLEGRCLSFGSTVPFLPVLDLVRAASGVADADPPEAAIEKVRSALIEVGLDPATSMSLVLHVLGLKDASEPVVGHLAGLGPEAIKTRTFDTLRQMALRDSRRRPLVIAIEDLHWIDRTSEEYLASLVDSLAGAAIMLLTTYRPGYRPAWLDKSYTTQLSLARLTSEDSLTVVRSVLPDTALADPRARLILDKAEGNPFFLEELARAVGDAGATAASLTVPDTVHGVLTARIDRLAEGPKRVLQTASVLGREFPVRLLNAVWEGQSLELHLQELVRQEFLYERSGTEERVYIFKHALTQDVAEATILASRRRELNAMAARALVELYPDRLAELAPRLAHHYVQAEAWAPACEHATRAAEAASAVYANREAVARYDQALAAGARAGLLGPERMRLHAARGRVHGALGEFDAARADLEAALALGREAGDPRACAELLGALGELWGGHQDYHRGLELTIEATRTAERAGDRRALAEALLRTGLMRLNLARMTESQHDLERALAIFQELGDEHGGARTLDVLATTDGIVGRVGRGIERGREALHRYQELGDRLAQSSMTTNIGFWLGWSGQREKAEPLVRQGLEVAIALGARGDEAYAHAGMGWILEMYGAYGPALRESTMAIELARQIGHREWTAAGLHIAGRIARECGQAARARALHEDMLALTRELGTALWAAAALAELGADLIELGDGAEGDRLLEEAITEAGEATEFVVAPLITRTDRLLRLGHLDAALDTARRTLAVATEYAVLSLDARQQEGQALIALGHLEAGERVLRDVQERARAIGAAPALWHACLTLADHMRARGRREEAAVQRAEALDWLERTAAELPDDLRQSFLDTPAMRRAREPDDRLRR